MSGSMPAEPMITFAAHLVRAGHAGAPEDFEQMIAQLVQATQGSAHRVFAYPGDWGIDVFTGDLNGRITVWQAKYFRNGVAKSQKDQIGKSFDSVNRAAQKHGHRIGRWILCTQCSLDAPTLKWWQEWKATQQRETGIQIDLWDETRLIELLMEPAAEHVRRIYYHPYQDLDAGTSAPALLSPPAAGVEPAGDWWGGE